MKPEQPQLIAEAEALGREAVNLKSVTGKSHRALALIYLAKGDSALAHEEILAALELSDLRGPSAFLGEIMRASGRPGYLL